MDVGNVNNQPNILVYKRENGSEWAIHAEYREGTFTRKRLVAELEAMQYNPTIWAGRVSINGADWVPVDSVDVNALGNRLFDAEKEN